MAITKFNEALETLRKATDFDSTTKDPNDLNALLNRKTTFEEMVESSLTDIIRDELHISEKNFKNFDRAMAASTALISDSKIASVITEGKNQKKRYQLIAEEIYFNHQLDMCIQCLK